MPVCVVTGASRGIGAATAARLVSDGWEVVGVSRSTGHDLTVPGVMTSLLTRIRPDAVVCAAGAIEPMAIRFAMPDSWERAWRLHVGQSVEACQWAISSHLAGPVVLLGSTSGQRPSPDWAAYAATKAAVHNFGLSAAVEGAEVGTRVYVVAPGRCATELRARIAPHEDPATIMQPVEVADVIAACFVDTAGVLAGQVLEVARR